MPTESQLDTGIHMVSLGFGDGMRAGQRLTIPNRTVTKLSFYLAKTGSPNGNVTFAIRKVSDDSLIASKVWGNANTLPTDPAWKEVTLDAPVLINEEVRIYQEYDATALPNGIKAYATVTDVKAGENWCDWNFVDDWRDFGSGGTNYDAPYIYTYEEPVSLSTVTTDPVTSVEEKTAIGNGDITDNGGEDCDKRGFVYDTSPRGDPGDTAPADSEYADYVEETDSFGTGVFTGALTSLIPNTTYYVRAYAHNSAGYSYGDEVSFTTLAGMSGLPPAFLELLGY